MSAVEHSYQEFLDALQTGADEDAFEKIGERVAHRLGFRWFAYLSLSDDVDLFLPTFMDNSLFRAWL